MVRIRSSKLQLAMLATKKEYRSHQLVVGKDVHNNIFLQINSYMNIESNIHYLRSAKNKVIKTNNSQITTRKKNVPM